MSTVCGLDINRIVYLTSMPQHSVYHILSTWRLEGEVKTILLPKPGHPRVLDFTNTQVCLLTRKSTNVTDNHKFLLKTVTHHNNMYLNEFRVVLED